MSEKPSLTRPIEILLVDDDLADIKLACRALEKEQLKNNVHIARDGIEALKFLRREDEHAHAPRPDLVLLDLNMPLKDGRETLHEIKQDPHLRTIPVVIVTTSQSDQDVEQSYQEHANSYVTKPLDMEQFQRALASLTAYWFSVVKLPARA